MKKILIISYYRYPNGDAGAVRQHAFAKLYKELGYDVTVVGMGAGTNFSIKENEGISYISLRYNKNGIIAKLRNYLCFKLNLKHFLKLYGECQYIQIVDLPVNALFFLKRYAQKHNIRLLYDSVEWYSPEEFKNGKFSVSYILKEKYNTKWIDKQFSVLAISSFLENHFKSRGINTVRIPVIMNISEIPCEKRTTEGKMVFLYAGSPCKKDYVAEIVSSFCLLPKEILGKCELRLAGIDESQLVSLCGVNENTIDALGDVLVCLGRVKREEVLNQLSQASFTVLLRSETQRYAKAGFPTKVVESLSTATPVITNLTSDLGFYLKDSYNALIVQKCTSDSFSDTVKRAINLSDDEKQAMFENSRKTAEKYFNYSLYGNKLLQLLENRNVNDDKLCEQ